LAIDGKPRAGVVEATSQTRQAKTYGARPEKRKRGKFSGGLGALEKNSNQGKQSIRAVPTQAAWPRQLKSIEKEGERFRESKAINKKRGGGQ